MNYVITASTGFTAIGSQHRLSVTDPAVLTQALCMAKEHLVHLDLAASRFRIDSEVMTLANLPAEADGLVRATISPLLVGYVEKALEVAAWSDGLVDPTLGRALIANGYDQHIEEVRNRRTFTRGLTVPPSDWTRITLSGNRIELPAGTLIDLGATAKAHAADVIAALLAARLPGGFLVSLGGDCAVSGQLPQNGWAVALTRHDGSVAQLVTTLGSALATSSTRHRAWQTADGAAHHILDPRTGHPAADVWASVTCASSTATLANAASTAAVVLGDDAPQWLRRRGVPARLERRDGSVVTTTGWPTDHGDIETADLAEMGA